MAKKKLEPRVAIVMGSDSDLPIMTETAKTLAVLDVPYEIEITSAHRSPKRTSEYTTQAASRGLRVIIAGAGGAFHLAGMIAAETTLPVIAVPIGSSPLAGWDALLAAVQMPGGVPVGVMAVGKAGAINAAIYAAQILATADEALAQRLVQLKNKMADDVVDKSARMKQEFGL
ncbi:MAG: 5-(carboxyamino)imidazole ribonucleotide mutase [Acidobacteria bacterium]|nr:5-(carboxyamino)imidazole ribonucleotide mutase [Acidobacteriota bacterium]